MSDKIGVPQPSTVPSGEQRGPVRQKVAVACDECRARKPKCDGIRPSMLSLIPTWNQSALNYTREEACAIED
jgi:hypothetical protein